MVFVCHSWLLFLGNREILPAHLNMVDFINDFRILESYERDDFGDKWRVFGADFEKEHAKTIERLSKPGLIEIRDGFLRLTRSGLEVQNAVVVELMEE